MMTLSLRRVSAGHKIIAINCYRFSFKSQNIIDDPEKCNITFGPSNSFILDRNISMSSPSNSC